VRVVGVCVVLCNLKKTFNSTKDYHNYFSFLLFSLIVSQKSLWCTEKILQHSFEMLNQQLLKKSNKHLVTSAKTTH
jgi:hypothetical protein